MLFQIIGGPDLRLKLVSSGASCCFQILDGFIESVASYCQDVGYKLVTRF